MQSCSLLFLLLLSFSLSLTLSLSLPLSLSPSLTLYITLIDSLSHSVTHFSSPSLSVHQTVVYVPNHTSFIDILVMSGFVPRPFKYLSKSEIMDIPVIGWAMKLAKHVFLKRDDIRSTLEVTDSCVERVRTYTIFSSFIFFFFHFPFFFVFIFFLLCDCPNPSRINFLLLLILFLFLYFLFINFLLPHR